jgi:hypothetical protein
VILAFCDVTMTCLAQPTLKQYARVSRATHPQPISIANHSQGICETLQGLTPCSDSRTGAFSKNFRLRGFIQVPLKALIELLTRTMQARMRVIERGFQSMAVNGCPFLAVQTHVPSESLVVCDSKIRS